MESAAKWLKGCIFSPDIKVHLARVKERAASVSLELPERLIKNNKSVAAGYSLEERDISCA